MTQRLETRRLHAGEIAVLRSLFKRATPSSSPISLSLRERKAIAYLWRRRLVDVWFRHVPDCVPNTQGPYFALTIAGFRMAAAFAAPRQRRQQGSGR